MVGGTQGAGCVDLLDEGAMGRGREANGLRQEHASESGKKQDLKPPEPARRRR